jgi:hypothetical protein
MQLNISYMINEGEIIIYQQRNGLEMKQICNKNIMKTCTKKGPHLCLYVVILQQF